MAVKLAKLRQGLTLLSPGDQGMVAMLLDAGADPSFTFSEPQQLYLKAMQAIVEASCCGGSIRRSATSSIRSSPCAGSSMAAIW
jgi:hypothetical protein